MKSRLTLKPKQISKPIALLILIGFLAAQVVILADIALAGPPSEPQEGATPRPGYSMPNTNTFTTRNGPVVNQAHQVFTLFWQPSGYTYSRNYQTLINRFFKDAAADSGKTTNIYSSLSQYGVPYSFTFGDSYTDTSAFGNSDCLISGLTDCLSDAKIQARLNQLLPTLGATWNPNMQKVFFIYLPKGVGSCYTPNNTFCVQTNYCAYHHSYQFANGQNILYAVIPYAMSFAAKCGSQQHPNGDDADSAINLSAHEHNETITDPLHTAWIDADGRERADRCVWDFGNTLGFTLWGRYNQLINGNKYYIQRMWSNASNGCVQSGA